MRTFVGHSLDPEIRFKATAGGIGTALLKYMFEKKIIQTSISFIFDENNLRYSPKLIYSFEDYVPVGSIYHEIKIIEFIRNNLNEIKGGFACFCLPCQTKAIQHILKRSNHNCIILGLTCSSQQSIEATYYLLKRINVKKQEIKHLRYRGNGWPSGIQIELKNGDKKFVPNNISIWSRIFNSRLFVQPRCFKCTDTLNSNADISLADPWLKEYTQVKNDGYSLLMGHNNFAEKLIDDAQKGGFIYVESIDKNQIYLSQQSTIIRKKKYRNNHRIVNILMFMNNNLTYKKIVLSTAFLFNIHVKIKNLIERK